MEKGRFRSQAERPPRAYYIRRSGGRSLLLRNGTEITSVLFCMNPGPTEGPHGVSPKTAQNRELSPEGQAQERLRPLFWAYGQNAYIFRCVAIE